MYHIPVMLKETIDALNVKQDGIYFDGTLGGGGHSFAILRKGGRIIGTDLDNEALEECEKRFSSFDKKFILKHGNFKNAKQFLAEEGINSIDGAVIDLGISSHQVDADYRGFSYKQNARLDMRMNCESGLDAEYVVNNYEEKKLADIIYTYGEERYSRRIAAAIVRERAKEPIVTTGQLVEIIKNCVPFDPKSHPAKKTFQAIRIEVNGELDGLKEGIEDIFSMIKPGGRFSIISFHSLEDRIVKQTFSMLATNCICDKSLPVCVCGHKATGKLILKTKPSKEEIAFNSRSTSATLRVIEKIM